MGGNSCSVFQLSPRAMGECSHMYQSFASQKFQDERDDGHVLGYLTDASTGSFLIDVFNNSKYTVMKD